MSIATASKVIERVQGNLSFGAACDVLQRAPRLERLRKTLRHELSDSIFDQRTTTAQGGWARRLYSELSEYEHSRPNFRNGDLWESNGPVLSPAVFVQCGARIVETSTLCFLLVKMARPRFALAEDASELLKSKCVQAPQIAIAAYELLYGGRRKKRGTVTKRPVSQ